MSKHTTLPWKVDEITSGRCSVIGPSKESVLDTWSIDEGVDHKANARLIVNAVNNYDRLREALRTVVDAVHDFDPNGEAIDNTFTEGAVILLAELDNLEEQQ